MIMKRKKFLTEEQSGTLASCLVVITFFVVMFTPVGVMAKSYFWLVIVLVGYAMFAWAAWLLFTGRSRSKELLRFTLTVGVLGAVASGFLMFSLFTLQV